MKPRSKRIIGQNTNSKLDCSPTKVQISFAGTKHVCAIHTAVKVACFFNRILITKKLHQVYEIFTLKTEFKFLKCFSSSKNKSMYDRPAYSFQSVLQYTFRTKRAEKQQITDECSAGMCLNSQIDAVRPLHFYRAMGNRFQSTQTVVVVVVDFR